MDSTDKIIQAADFHAKSLHAIVLALPKEDVSRVKAVWLRELFYKPWKKIGESVERNDVQTLASIVEESCRGTHEWTRIVDEPSRICYRFTKCRWAEIFRELEATDLGKWFCDSDHIYVKAFNPKIIFKRTKTMMNGDEYCDHVFQLEDDDE